MKSLIILAALAACGPKTPDEPPVMTTERKQVAAETAYGAALQRCVVDNDTRANIDTCADGVRATWSKDGGR